MNEENTIQPAANPAPIVPPAAQPPQRAAKKRGKQRQNGGRIAGQGKWSKNVAKTGGMPSVYQKQNAKLGYQFALLGKTDEEIAAAFSVSIGTIYNWKRKHPKFKNSIQDGRDKADGRVVEKLYERAIGYNHKAIHFSAYEGQVTETPYVEHYPPDVGAQLAILKARHPATWRDKTTTEVTGPGGAPISTPITIIISQPPAPAEKRVMDAAPAKARPGAAPLQVADAAMAGAVTVRVDSTPQGAAAARGAVELGVEKQPGAKMPPPAPPTRLSGEQANALEAQLAELNKK